MLNTLKCLCNNTAICLESRLSTSAVHWKQKFKYPREDKDLEEVRYPISSESDRRVYAWGLNDHGALGNTRHKVRVKQQAFNHKPIRLHFAEQRRIEDVACGYGFTVFAVDTKESHKVFGCGINTDSQLGYQAAALDHPMDLLLTPAPIELPLSTQSNVISLAAGRAHLAVVTDVDGVMLLGNNAYGQCGRKVVNLEKYSGSHMVNVVPSVEGKRVVSACCGQDHTMLVADDGVVYTCGWAADGQTGRGTFDSDHQLQPVQGDIVGERVVKLSCAADCVLALTESGQVFGWGNSEYGQLPTQGDSQQVCESRHLSHLNSLGRVVDVAAGGSSCAVLTADGSVYVWGFGILGKGPALERSTEPQLIPATLFGRTQFSPDVRVTSIEAGLSHMMAVTSNGDVYAWGRNRWGCLGLGHDRDQFFPLRVALGAAALKVTLGVDHSVALCKPYV